MIRATIMAAIAMSTCSIICGSGCDNLMPAGIEPGCGEEGKLFGPCPPDSHICAPGLICLDSLPTGTICGIDSGVPTEEQAMCGDLFGWALDCSFFNDDCQLACASDEDCHGGTVCSTLYGACVHP